MTRWPSSLVAPKLIERFAARGVLLPRARRREEEKEGVRGRLMVTWSSSKGIGGIGGTPFGAMVVVVVVVGGGEVKRWFCAIVNARFTSK
jgi:hypothetical protein